MTSSSGLYETCHGNGKAVRRVSNALSNIKGKAK